MKRYSILFVVGLAVTAVSCQKDFLDRYPQTSVTPEVFFNTEEDLALNINGRLRWPDRYGYGNEKSWDNAATTGAVEVRKIMTGNPTSQNVTGGWSWERRGTVN